MRRLLIVSPHFPPVNAADHQRVRHALPHLRDLGWEPVVLAVRPEHVAEAVLEPLLESTYPPNVEVHRTGALPLRWTRPVGMSTLGWRCLPAVGQTGSRLLAERQFDAVFFSTTQFPVMALGPHWKRRFGTPYLVDFQDPWRSDYHATTGKGVRPPGGSWKFRLAQWKARQLEPGVVRRSSGVVCVSEAYPTMLLQRYPDVEPDRFEVLPFAGSAADFALMETAGVKQNVFNPADGLEHWVYAGRGGTDMAKALELLFRAFRIVAELRPTWAANVRLHFVGTAYAGDIPSIAPLAEQHGLSGVVSEYPRRLPYFEVLRALRDAAGLMVIGSDDPRYTASKIYPYLLAGRPLLAVLHHESGAGRVFEEAGAGSLVRFGLNPEPPGLAETAAVAWKSLLDDPCQMARPEVLGRYGASAMTKRLAEAFGRWLPS